VSELVIRALLITLATAVLAWPVGHLLGAWVGWAVFSAGLVVQMAFHIRHFARLERWSHAPSVDASLEGEGAWDDIFGRLYRHEKDLRDRIARRDREIDLMVAAAQALTDGVVLLDRLNQIQFCNTTAEAQLGLSAAKDRGASIVNLVRQPEFATYLEQGDHSAPLVIRLERNKDHVLSLQVMPFAGDRRLLQVRDVTQSDRLDRMRRDFVANVSHELRTPLTVLVGALETLQEIDLEPDERRHFLELMSGQSKRMQSIVQDLLTLSSIESAPPPDSDLVDMASLIDKLRRDAEALSDGRHAIVVEADGEGDLIGSETDLVSAFGNLVANAVRYTPAGGTVTLQWHASPAGAEFAVVDTGIGIEAKHLSRLTERFYRVDRGRSRDAGGTGLGLAIVKHALNRHQARLEITSTPGKGSRFAARFPAERVAGLPSA
jgi:two-component system phosphate regulon sensor histidine kinase PhoR